VTNITGSGLDDCIYCHLFTVTMNYNSSQSMTKTPFLTGLRVPSLPIVTDLVLIYELVTSTKTDLNDDSLTNDECRMTVHG
jgi:hypothetical protein